MTDEYNQAAGMCGGGGGGNWWDSSRTTTNTTRFDGSSSTSSASATYGWLTETADISTRSTMDDSASTTSRSAVFRDAHKLPGANNTTSAAAAAAAAMLIDPSLQIMGLGLSSQALDWNQSLLRNEKGAESSFRSIIQGISTSTNFNQEAGGVFGTQVQWRNSEKIFPGISGENSQEFKQINRGFSLDQPMETHHFQSESSSVYPTPSAIFQGLMSSDHHHHDDHGHQHHQQQQQQQQSSTFEYRPVINYAYNNQQQPSYGVAENDCLMPSWSKTPQFFRASPPKQPPTMPTPHTQLQITNSAPFWNASTAAAAVLDTARPSFFPSLQTPLPMTSFDEKPKHNSLEVRETMKKIGSDQTANKRQRNEASSTLPPFKARKEKMGDRITALQQLVSPFGKTDTASVLSEAIEYIKFLHEQVTVLSNPYLKSGAHHLQNSDKSKDPEAPMQDLRSRGLCLVPVSSTFPVAHETTVDFWTPALGGTFR
ncbi:hypothetical protein Nepgr_026163 [Nepenthes gracilis]|uniref:BHLH domain-containing protein n=1 Tax=Nepenthes gracilis TaxID=150966 RepID=A0AAD3T6F6_NEPGR|nr:hypothetical protein Nepgr_026163 [Nepenthes gracilis]